MFRKSDSKRLRLQPSEARRRSDLTRSGRGSTSDNIHSLSTALWRLFVLSMLEMIAKLIMRCLLS